MKTRFVLTVIFAAGVLVCGCGKEADFAGGSGNGNENGSDTHACHYVTVSAGTEAQGDGGASTKAVANETGGDFYWQKNDRIGVFAGEEGKIFPLAIKSIDSNFKNATFSGAVEGEICGYAVYPYNESHKISGDTLTYHLPSTYTYTGVDTDCVTTMSAGGTAKNSANPPLFAGISQEGGGTKG